MSEHTVEVNGTLLLAEKACRMVFGEDPALGPLRPAPRPLLDILDKWPAPPDAVLKVALELPWDFDVSKEMLKGERKSVVLYCNRVTILHLGKKVGYAIRTDALGFNALDVWTSANETYLRQLRQAH